MNRYNQFRGETGRSKERQGSRPGLTPIRCIEEIPHEATPQEAFRLNAQVVRIIERETDAGDPYWFVKCEDEEGLRFDVVVWEAQMRRLRLEVDMTLALDLRVPKQGYNAFTLV